VVEAVLNGFNGTIFAYGQTGSGKSHSMFGMDGSIRLQPGIVPRCVKDLFQGLKSSPRSNISSVYVSFLQVYNEQVFDMFSKGPMISLSIREKNCDVFVSNLKQYHTQSFDQCIKLIEAGLENRAIRETTMNHASSRSHSILQIVVEQDMFENNECKRICSKLNLVDLAGSERWGVNGMGDEQISELTNINSSLHTLGRCVAALARTSRHEQGTVQGPNKNIHIPFRDSKLTRLLQDSLGGNAKTCLLATINPSLTCGDESICTLRFADCAHQVMTHAKINEDTTHKEDPEMKVLRDEIYRLKQLLQQNGITDPPQQLEALSENSPIENNNAWQSARDNGPQFGSESRNSVETQQPQQHDKLVGLPRKLSQNEASKATVYDDSTCRISAEEPSVVAALGEQSEFRLGLLEKQPAALSTTALDEMENSNECAEFHIESMPSNETCRRIIGMLGSVLTLVDTFLTSVSVSYEPNSGAEKKQNFTNPSSPEDNCDRGEGVERIGGGNMISTPLVMHQHHVLKKKHGNENKIKNSTRPKKNGDESTLTALLSRRKQLKGGIEESSNLDVENKLKKQLVKALKKKDQKLQLRDWFLEKEQKAEHPMSRYILEK